MIVGNGDDDYLDREAADSEQLNALETEMAIGACRLRELAAMIGHFRFLKTASSTRSSIPGSLSISPSLETAHSGIETGPLVAFPSTTRSSRVGPRETDQGEDAPPDQRVDVDIA